MIRKVKVCRNYLFSGGNGKQTIGDMVFKFFIGYGITEGIRAAASRQGYLRKIGIKGQQFGNFDIQGEFFQFPGIALALVNLR